MNQYSEESPFPFLHKSDIQDINCEYQIIYEESLFLQKRTKHMIIFNFVGSQIARYFFVPFITIFLNWFIRRLCITNRYIDSYDCSQPLIGIDLSVSSFLLVILDVSIHLSSNKNISPEYAASIMYASVCSLIMIFAIILILRGHMSREGIRRRRLATVIIGIVSIALSYLFMKN